MAAEIFLLPKLDKSIKGHNTLRKGAKNGFVFPQFYGDYYKNNAPSLACDWGELPKYTNWKRDSGIIVQDDLHLGQHMIDNDIKNLDQFTEHIRKIESDFWNKRYKVYSKWRDSIWEFYQQNGYVDLKTGFRCSGVMSRNDVTNYPVQGAAFHCLLKALVTLTFLFEQYKLDTKIIGQIHDSIILDVNPKELKQVSKLAYETTVNSIPQAWDWITVPLDVDAELGEVDGSWDTVVEDKNFKSRIAEG